MDKNLIIAEYTKLLKLLLLAEKLPFDSNLHGTLTEKAGVVNDKFKTADYGGGKTAGNGA